MDLLYPLIGGISAKVYDDILDNDIPANDIFKEALKAIQCFTLALTCIGDFNFTFLFYSMVFINYLADRDAYKIPYEQALLYLVPIFLVLSFHTIKYFQINDFVYFLFFGLGMIIDPFFFNENVSYNKLIIRSLSLLSAICVFFFRKYLYISSSILKLGIYMGAYTATSCIFQFYILQYGGHQANSPEIKESKESELKEKEPQAPEPKEKNPKPLNPQAKK